MGYRLHIENETYPIQVVQTPTEILLTHKIVREQVSFISPVRLITGQTCGLCNDSTGYQLLVKSCLGFSFSPQFFVSGILAPKDVTATSEATDPDSAAEMRNLFRKT